MLAALLNGVPINASEPALHADERAAQYGDGVFETMLLRDGRVRFFVDHLQRLQQGCERLLIAKPDTELLHNELTQLIARVSDGVVKLIVTRGRGGRGYRPPADAVPIRLWQLFVPVQPSNSEITLRWCHARLSRNPLLAGIKHLNRLEQVLAQAEWSDTNIAEGLMLDTDGELISGTMSNLFLIIDNVLVTPDLRLCGVRGVMRGRVLQSAQRLGLTLEERSVRPMELLSATEVFMTNAVRGIQPVVEIVSSAQSTMGSASYPAKRWSVGKVTVQLQAELAKAEPINAA